MSSGGKEFVFYPRLKMLPPHLRELVAFLNSQGHSDAVIARDALQALYDQRSDHGLQVGR